MKSSRSTTRGAAAPTNKNKKGGTTATVTTGHESALVNVAKTEDEEVELSSSSQETSSSSPRSNLKGGDGSNDLDGDGASTAELSVLDNRARKRRRCYTFLVCIIFAAGVALVVLSVTMFHQRGPQQQANQVSSSSASGGQQENEQPPPTSTNPENSVDRNGDDSNATTANNSNNGGFQQEGSNPAPTRFPSLPPSVYTTGFPSFFPTYEAGPTSVPTTEYEATTTTFYAIGDVPYDDLQASQITVQVQNIPASAEFVIHVGDVRNASDSMPCTLDEFERASSIFKLSKVPVFVIMGDNDWNDCPNYDEGLQYWRKEFLFFESRYWNHTFNITREPGRDESFTFRHKGTLFIGLNLVGGKVLDKDEWEFRLTSQFNWTAQLIREYKADVYPNTGRVVLFGHCNPTSHHAAFFNPLKDFVQNELGDRLPLLYLNGDQHKWKYEDNYLSQEYMLRIMVTGGSKEPPLKVVVNSNGFLRPVNESFVYDRDLTNKSQWLEIP